jgi:endogenous inhibitor of DNA gyrase (YacG/DUF329 family)
MTGERTCPICKRPISTDGDLSFRPFCGERCKTIDLGSWLDNKYRISRSFAEEDLDASPVVEEEDPVD